MGNVVVHFEIGATDAVKAREFYTQLFGWQTDSDPSGYQVVRTGSDHGIGGGIMPTPEGQSPWVTIYVTVDDLAQHLARVEELGGKQLIGPTPIEGMGAFAVFTDPDGNALGLFTSDSP